MDLENKVAVVTGASGGIGSAVARQLDKQGCHVVLAARSVESLRELEKELQNKSLTVEMDVADDESVRKAFEQVSERFSSIHILVNTAGVMPLSYLKNLHLDEWLNTIEVNVKGILRTLHSALPAMKKQKQGHIVNIASVDGKELFKGGAIYGASKAAVIALSRAMRMELSPEFNIKVTSIEPGTVATDLREDITDEELLDDKNFSEDEAKLSAAAIARSVVYAISESEEVNVNEILIKPTGKS